LPIDGLAPILIDVRETRTRHEEEEVGDPFGKITSGQDILGKIRNLLGKFGGYVDRDNRREADKLLRETVGRRYEEQWARISEIQKQLANEGQLEQVDDLESAAVKLRAFIDRISRASHGYAGFFDAVRINEAELVKLYEYDLKLLENVNLLSQAVDNVVSSVGAEGLPAAIRNLVTVSQEAIDAFNRRDEVLVAV
jgi:hypothetical protein